MSSIQIRVAVLQICNDATCSVAPDLARHLRVEYRSVDIADLAKTLFLAASYTWGEFSRAKRAIGHDSKGGEISMELGCEWNLQDFIDTLAKVCTENSNKPGAEHAGIWIDQLCIDQTDERAKRDTLASIPSIYRALEVVEVMPGGNCSCLRKCIERLSNTGPDAEEGEIWDIFDRTIGTRRNNFSSCLNYLGMNSYFDRVWTRQELLYSRSIRIVRTSADDLPCVRDEADVDKLSDFSRQLYRRHASQANAYSKLLKANFAFWNNIDEAADELEMEHEGGSDALHSSGLAMFRHKMLTVHAFLLGQKLVRPQVLGKGSDGQKLVQFLKHLEGLAVSTRKATKAKDYVLSVWVDCPGYVLPTDFSDMPLPHLLEDAIKQLERKYSVSIQASKLPGLFGGSLNESALWRPTAYLTQTPTSAADIYGPILQSLPIRLLYRRSALPLKISSPPEMPLSSRASYYPEHFSGRSVDDVKNAMCAIVRNWASNAGSRVVYFHGFTNSIQLEDEGGHSFIFKANIILFDDDTFRPHMSRIPVNFDHHQAVYEMVAVALGLGVEDCRRHNLRLMVIPEVAIGFTLNDVGRGAEARKVITISTAPPSHEGALLEASLTAAFAVTQSDTLIPRYSVTGIWVPIRNQDKFKFTAYTGLTMKHFNAVLA